VPLTVCSLSKENSVEYATFRWTPGVPIAYRFEDSIDTYTRELIRLSLKYWEEHSCLSFQENGTTRPMLRFFKGQGCYSLVGRVFDQEEQEISIGPGCEMFGTITHEVAHSLGLFHHHSRYDRDDHITVVTANLRPGWDRQFAKETPEGSTNLNVDYDYGSNMHYTGFDPATNKIMFLANKTRYQHTMGNHYGPMFSDVLTLNRYYQCSDKCQEKVVCQNNGFPHPRDCAKCICPDGFGGTGCSSRAAAVYGAPANCGETLKATSEFKTLSANVTSGPTRGPSNIADRHATCFFHIKAPAGERIEMKVTKLRGSCMNECVLSGLEVKYENLTRVGAHLCCPKHIEEFGNVTTDGDLAIVSVYSQRGVQSFELQYRAVKLTQNVTESALASTTKVPTTTKSNASCQDKMPNCQWLKGFCKSRFFYKQIGFMCQRTCQTC
jgi:astacin